MKFCIAIFIQIVDLEDYISLVLLIMIVAFNTDFIHLEQREKVFQYLETAAMPLAPRDSKGQIGASIIV